MLKTLESQMIRCYGLHWHINEIEWGWQNFAGRLRGSQARDNQVLAVDFRRQRGIYALYSNYELVYIGRTGAGANGLLNRLRAHTRDHLADRWDRFSWFGILGLTEQNALSDCIADVDVETAVAINILEAVTIAIAEPRLNLQRGQWGDATQYFQLSPVES